MAYNDIYGFPTDYNSQQYNRSQLQNNYNPEQQDISRQLRMADMLRQQSMQPLDGQMVSGHYVAPSITQYLAKALQGYNANKTENNAYGQQKAYQAAKNQSFVDLTNANKPQQIAGTPVTTTTTPAYTPDQQDQFGSPLPNVQRQPVTTTDTPMTQETSAQQYARIQPQVLDYVKKYGNTPEAQYLMSALGKQEERGYAQGQKLDDRTYAAQNENTLHTRNRGEQVADSQDSQDFQTGMQTSQFAHADQSQLATFGHEDKTTASNHRFEAGQNALKLAATEADTPTLTTDALDTAAELYRTGGGIPPLGQGKAASALRSSIINRAGEINKAGGLTAFQASNNIISGKNLIASQKSAGIEFAKGKDGNQVRSLNVAMSHLDTLGDLSTALNNNDTQALNKLGNLYKSQTGNPAPTNFNTAKQIVSDEIVKAVVGAGGTGQDRQEAAAVISAANSPAQLTGAIQTYQKLIGGQLGGLKQQYQQSTGKNDFDTMLSPETLKHFNPPQPQASSGVKKYNPATGKIE